MDKIKKERNVCDKCHTPSANGVSLGSYFGDHKFDFSLKALVKYYLLIIKTGKTG